MDTPIEEFLVTHKSKDLIKIYGLGTTLGEFPPETVDFDALPYMEKVIFQQKLQSTLTKYNGFWVYVLSPSECFEGRLDHTQVRICQVTSVLTKDLGPFYHQVAVSREDYELIHISANNTYACEARFKGLGERPIFYEDDLDRRLCFFADTFVRYDEFRLLSIRDYPNDDPEEPDYDWTVQLIIQYRDSPKEIELFSSHLLQQIQEFWTHQYPHIQVFESVCTRISPTGF